MAPISDSHGHMVSYRTHRSCAPPVHPVPAWCAVSKSSSHPDGSDPFNAWNYHQSAQLLRHCLQVVCAFEPEIYSLLDGDCDYPLHLIY